MFGFMKRNKILKFNKLKKEQKTIFILEIPFSLKLNRKSNVIYYIHLIK